MIESTLQTKQGTIKRPTKAKITSQGTNTTKLFSDHILIKPIFNSMKH